MQKSIRFINETNGAIFNGERPYVFWFEDGQSVNLQYVKRIMVISDSPAIEFEVEKNNKFYIIDTKSLLDSSELIDNLQFRSLNDGSSETHSLSISYKHDDTAYDQCIKWSDGDGHDYYIYPLYILASSDETGEFVASLTMTTKTPNGDDLEYGEDDIEVVYCIGADFYAEDETLSSNLENLGIEIPQAVQKAVYETDVFEDLNDSITLNRKWKELLLEYANISMNKGSYSSLIDSLKWFEYGDLVKIYEYWKRNDEALPKLLANDMEKLISDLYRKQLAVLSKTTYVSLELALQKMAKNGIAHYYEDDFYPVEGSHSVYSNIPYEDSGWLPTNADPTIVENNGPQVLQVGNPRRDGEDIPTEIYDNTSDSLLNGANFYALDEEVVSTTSNLMLRENNPQLYDVAKAFEDIEMCIKMTLLGNFYSTYFMPLHLDMFHSTVERIVFANTTKCLSAGCLSRKDVIAPVFSMKCYTGSAHKQIEAVHCYVSPSTVFGILDGEHTIGIDFNTNELQYNTIEESFMSVRDVFGAVVPMHVVIDKHIANGDFIKSEFISLKKEGERAVTTASAIVIEQTPDNGGKYKFDANFIIPSAGKWEVTVVFETAIGISYKKTMRFDVADCADNPINLYLVERCDENELEKLSIEYTDNELLISKTGDELVHTIIDGFSFSQVGHDDYRFGEAFIACSRSDDADIRVAGVNHLVMAVIDNNVTTLSTPSFELAISSTSIDSINQYFPEYLWFIKETYIRLNGEALFEKKPVIVGLRKVFSNETNEAAKVSVSSAYNGRCLSTDVFVPAFHKLNPDFTYNEVKQGMVVMAVPSYSIMKNADGIGWLFKNASTGEQWSLQSNGGELVIPAATAVGKQSFSALTPGCYDISLSYKFGDEVKTHSRKRAFLLQR